MLDVLQSLLDMSEGYMNYRVLLKVPFWWVCNISHLRT